MSIAAAATIRRPLSGGLGVGGLLRLLRRLLFGRFPDSSTEVPVQRRRFLGWRVTALRLGPLRESSAKCPAHCIVFTRLVRY